MNLQQKIESCHEECKECIEYFNNFEKFSPTMCKFCTNGAKLHKLEIMASKSEKKWDSCNWNSAKLKDFYKG